jgi:hypothetical protein
MTRSSRFTLRHGGINTRPETHPFDEWAITAPVRQYGMRLLVPVPNMASGLVFPSAIAAKAKGCPGWSASKNFLCFAENFGRLAATELLRSPGWNSCFPHP